MNCLRAVDESKDQSYFLYGLTQEQMSRTIFPLGELDKQSVREIARRAALPVAEKAESQEICFVPSGHYVQFIESYSDRARRIAVRKKKAKSSRRAAKSWAAIRAFTGSPWGSGADWEWPSDGRSTSFRSTADRIA